MSTRSFSISETRPRASRRRPALRRRRRRRRREAGCRSPVEKKTLFFRSSSTPWCCDANRVRTDPFIAAGCGIRSGAFLRSQQVDEKAPSAPSRASSTPNAHKKTSLFHLTKKNQSRNKRPIPTASPKLRARQATKKTTTAGGNGKRGPRMRKKTQKQNRRLDR